MHPICGWRLAVFGIAGCALLPVAAIVWLAIFPAENIWPHLVATVLPKYIANTLLLLLGVGGAVLCTGVVTAHLITAYEFPLRRVLEYVLLLPLAVPAYVLAYLYTDLLEFAGPVQSTLRMWFGWRLAGDYWFPEIRSLGGAVAVLGLALYPYVYLLTRAALLEQSRYLNDVSRLQGRGAFGAFVHIALPVARPAIAVGVALALMEALNDFGTVDFFAVQTLTAGLYDVWLNMNNLGGGAQIAATMLTFALLLTTLELLSRRRQRFYQSATRYADKPRQTLRGTQQWLAVLICMLPALFGFIVPFIVLTQYAVENWQISWSAEFRAYVWNSLWVSGIAALTCVGVAVVVGYARRLHTSAAVNFSARIAGAGYALPGAVLAVGVAIPFAAIDNAVDEFMRAYFGVSTGLIFSGGVFLLLFAYVIRFSAVALGAVDASFGKISASMDFAARALGHTKFQTLRRFHLPLLRGGISTAGLIVFVDCMKELPATLLLRPFNFETLATHVYHFASDEMLAESALGALLLVGAGILPVLVLGRAITQITRPDYATE